MHTMRNRSIFKQFNLRNLLLFQCVRFELHVVLHVIDIQAISALEKRRAVERWMRALYCSWEDKKTVNHFHVIQNWLITIFTQHFICIDDDQPRFGCAFASWPFTYATYYNCNLRFLHQNNNESMAICGDD